MPKDVPWDAARRHRLGVTMAWRKEQRRLIEDLETIVFHANEGWRDLQRAKARLFVEDRGNALIDLDMVGHCLHQARDVATEMRGRYPGGANRPENWHSSNEIANDIRFAIRLLEELKFDGSMVAAEAKSRLERALEKLGVGDG